MGMSMYMGAGRGRGRGRGNNKRTLSSQRRAEVQALCIGEGRKEDGHISCQIGCLIHLKLDLSVYTYTPLSSLHLRTPPIHRNRCRQQTLFQSSASSKVMNYLVGYLLYLMLVMGI